MPTYVYRCERCTENFEQTESITEHGTTKPRCPKCGSDNVATRAPFVAMTTKRT